MVNDTTIRVLLLRSGATAWDDAGRLGGACDLPMSEAGRAALRASFAGLNGMPVSSIFTAPDEASVETARALRAVKGGRVKVLEGLREIDIGLWEGLRPSEIEEKCPTAYRQWVEYPESVLIPEGESLEAAEERIAGTLGRALDRLRPDAGLPAVVVRPVAFSLLACLADGVPPARLGEAATGPGTRMVSLPLRLLGRVERKPVPQVNAVARR